MKEIKRSIITKQVKDFKINRKIVKTYVPQPGDVAVFQILKIGKHKAVQGVRGNNNYIFPEDKILAVFGTRYATGQFEGYVPEKYHSRYQILGQGGVVGILKSMHAKFEDVGPTEVKLIGYAVNKKGTVINTRYLNQKPITYNSRKKRDYPIYLSLGSSMDSGKTTTAAFLCRGLKKQKKKVAYIKLTGTVYAKDCSIVRDCGADSAVDFAYCGYPSTYMCSTKEILNIFAKLLKRVERINPDAVVVEIADGLLQRETKALIKSKRLRRQISGVILSCGDSMAVDMGIRMLSKYNLKPFAISGLFTASPLLTQEAVEYYDIPVLTLEDFLKPELTEYIKKGKLSFKEPSKPKPKPRKNIKRLKVVNGKKPKSKIVHYKKATKEVKIAGSS